MIFETVFIEFGTARYTVVFIYAAVFDVVEGYRRERVWRLLNDRLNYKDVRLEVFAARSCAVAESEIFPLGSCARPIRAGDCDFFARAYAYTCLRILSGGD